MNSAAPVMETLLAIDVGTIRTRVYLFEVADGVFRYISGGSAPSTAEAPVKDIGEGIMAAIRNLEELSFRAILGEDGRFIIPSQSAGRGVDGLCATVSAGPEIKVIVAGLLASVSLESAEHLARTSYTRVMDSVSIADSRKMDAQIDAILKALPDAIILAGGSDDGAIHSMRRVLTTLGISCSLLPPENRPEILFAGNPKVQATVKSYLEINCPVTYTSNIRPQPEVEQLDPARHALMEVVNHIRMKRMTGVNELNNLVGGRLMPTASSFGRMVRFMGKIYKSQNGVMGIDVGSLNTTVAIGKNGQLASRVSQVRRDQETYIESLTKIKTQELIPWIGYNVSEDYIREYLLNKAAYPGGIPSTPEDLAIENAFTRFRLSYAIQEFASAYSGMNIAYRRGLQPGFEPIIVSGTAVTGAPTLGQSLLMILDGLQPVGITTIVLDENNLLPVLGAAGQVLPNLPVEVLESGALLNLCTLITPVSGRKMGTPILKMHVITEDDQETEMEVLQGSLMTVPLSQGETARIFLEPINNAELGLGQVGASAGFKVTAGALGIVIDARGRPVRTPTEILARQEMLQLWLSTLGG
jgi:hypothetical protein